MRGSWPSFTAIADAECDPHRVDVPPYFALSMVLTWTSHSWEAIHVITRMFDFFLASEPLMPVFFATSVSIVPLAWVSWLQPTDVGKQILLLRQEAILE